VEPLADDAEIYQALVVGKRETTSGRTVQESGSRLSGGIDSALTVCIAVDGPRQQNVVGVMMPSPFSSQGSVDDSVALAKASHRMLTIPINPVARRTKTPCRIIQECRTRGPREICRPNSRQLLMALSNKFGWIV